MKRILISIILSSSAFGQVEPSIDMAKLAKTLRLGSTELRIEDVTKRESDARKLPLKSAWIVSSPEHHLFFPLVIYTAPKGVLYSKKHEAIRNVFRERPPKEGDFGYGLGFFEVPKIGECFVFLEPILIASNKPPRVESGITLPAWRPTRKSVLSIIGQLDSENLDFQIGLLLFDEDELEDFPEFKSMLYGPDLPVQKELASALVEVVRDSNILITAKDRPDKRSDNDAQKDSGKAEDLIHYLPGNTQERGRPERNSGNPGLPHWALPMGMGALIVALILILVLMCMRRMRDERSK